MQQINTQFNTVLKKKRRHAAIRLLNDIYKCWQLYVIFLLPLLYILIFKYYPMYGAIIAFKNFNPIVGIAGSPWVGLDHIVQFIHSYEFVRVLKNTLVLGLYQLIAGFPFPILLALSLNYVVGFRFKKVVQMITYAPHFISVVVIVGMVLVFLDPRGGINHILGLFGVAPIHFMGKPQLFMSIYVWSGIWQNVGFGCIVYLAALSAINPELHEAATVDGAIKLRRIWHIDLPGIMPVTVILLLLHLGNFLDIGFEKVLLMQNPLNLSTSEVIDTYVYKIGLTAQIPQYSYAAAIGLFKSFIALVLIVGANWISRRVSQESLW